MLTLYGSAISNYYNKVSDETRQDVRAKLETGLKSLARLAQFGPYAVSENLSAADCAAWPHFTVIGLASSRVYGEDLVATHPPAVADYPALMETRPAVQQVAADRAKAREAFYATRKP